MPNENPTIGLEIEFQGVGESILNPIDYIPFTIHDDGSTRGAVYVLQDGALPIILQRSRGGNPVVPSGVKRARDIGLEMITTPMRYQDIKDPLVRLSDYLRFVPQTPRTSVHVHVDVANIGWKLCRNVVLWAYALEAPLFRLACGGGFHRGERSYNGESTDYRFCRPLSDPILAFWGLAEGPLVLWDDLINANSASEFVASWGRLDAYWAGLASLPHYIGHRLHMVNLCSILRIGTLEWRLFDGIYSHIGLFVDLVMAMHKLAYKGPPDFEPMLLGTEPNIDQYELSRLLDVDISPLWGKRWPKGCKRSLHPHYGKLVLAPLKKKSVYVFDGDNGSSDVPLSRR